MTEPTTAAGPCPTCYMVHRPELPCGRGRDWYEAEARQQDASTLRDGYEWDCPNCGEHIHSWIKPPALAAPAGLDGGAVGERPLDPRRVALHVAGAICPHPATDEADIALSKAWAPCLRCRKKALDVLARLSVNEGGPDDWSKNANALSREPWRVAKADDEGGVAPVEPQEPR